MKHLEDTEAEALWQWAQTQPIPRDYLLHIPNGGKRNVREAARLKKQGVRAGVSDYLLAYPCGGYHGLWIELKAGRGKPTKPQKPTAKSISKTAKTLPVPHPAVSRTDQQP